METNSHTSVLKASTRKIALSSAGLAAFILVSRYWLSRSHSSASSSQPDGIADEYDYIIVGGGTAGCVLAARLSEDPNVRVLLLEAGGSGKDLLFSRIPAAFGRLFYSRHCFPLRTESQVHAKGQKVFWPRAKMLGGCSSVNAQMAQYGSPEDFDEWGQFMNDDSWSWGKFGKYFRKFEKVTADPSYPDVDLAHRGTEGPVRVGYFNYAHPISKQFLKACDDVGIPPVADFNGPKGPIGASRMMTYVDEKRNRVSSETAYLTPDVLKRKNLKVATNILVRKVLTETVEGKLRATKVEIAKSKGDARRQIRAKKEIILAAGAIHSPHILLLSGIGPADHLKEHGIALTHELPGVGKNLVDHPVLDIYFRDKLKHSLNYVQPQSLSQLLRLGRVAAQYLSGNGGPLSTNLGESAAFVRSDDPKLFPPAEYSTQVIDTTSSKNSPDLEFYTTPLAYKEHGLVNWKVPTFALHVYLLRPSSRGEIRLRSSNPYDAPIIDPHYLETPEDQEKLFRGLKLLLKISRTKPILDMVQPDKYDKTLDHDSYLKSDDEIRQLVKERCETVYHPTSSCRMAPLDQGGVVDTEMKVYGVEGLRVCDASIFPFIVSGHTAGACFAVGEKLADMLRGKA